MARWAQIHREVLLLLLPLNLGRAAHDPKQDLGLCVEFAALFWLHGSDAEQEHATCLLLSTSFLPATRSQAATRPRKWLACSAVQRHTILVRQPRRLAPWQHRPVA